MERGFSYAKSTKVFKKKNDFFEYHISFTSNMRNYGNDVDFSISMNVFSPKYIKWIKTYYSYDHKIGGDTIDGGYGFNIPDWDDKYMDACWYSLWKYDNLKIVEKIMHNLTNAAFPYFERFSSIELAINELLKKKNDSNFRLIFDFYVIIGNFHEAINFFENNNGWFESELDKNEEDSYFISNFKTDYLIRKKEYFRLKETI